MSASVTRSSRPHTLCALALALSTLAAPAARAASQAPGHIDTTFGKRGVAMLPVGPTDDHAEAMVVQPDGKVIVAGWGNGSLGYAFELARFDRDGALDKTFGHGGRVIASIGGGVNEVHAMALQADGRIVVAGSGAKAQGTEFAVARFNVDGSLDRTFGDKGQVVTSFGSASDEAHAVVVQPDGRIVAGGFTYNPATGIDFALARYNADGSLDAGFGNGGRVVTHVHAADGNDSINALALQTVGDEVMIVAAGGEGDFTLHRYHADGSDDRSFGNGQRTRTEFGSVIGAARAMAVDSRGRLVVAGHIDHEFALLRLLPDGSRDATFGHGGRVKTKVSKEGWNEAQAVLIQADDRILVGGWCTPDGSSATDSVIVRYDVTGGLDPTFGKRGKTVTAVSPVHADQGMAIALQADEQLGVVRSLLAGWGSVSDEDFYVVRYWN